MTDLNLCPVCGKEVIYSECHLHLHIVKCSVDDTDHIIKVAGRTKEEALAKWHILTTNASHVPTPDLVKVLETREGVESTSVKNPDVEMRVKIKPLKGPATILVVRE